MSREVAVRRSSGTEESERRCGMPRALQNSRHNRRAKSAHMQGGCGMRASLSRCVLCPESLTDQAAVSLCGGGGARRRWGKCETRDDFKSRATSTSAVDFLILYYVVSRRTTTSPDPPPFVSGTPFGAGDRGPARRRPCRAGRLRTRVARRRLSRPVCPRAGTARPPTR